MRKQTRHFSDAWDEFARDVELAALDIDPDEVFAEVRDRAAEREHKVDVDPKYVSSRA